MTQASVDGAPKEREKPDSTVSAARIQAKGVVIAAVITGVFSLASYLLGLSLGEKRAEEPEEKTAAEIVIPPDLPDTIVAADKGLAVKGRLITALPPGKQLWSAQRQSDGVSHDDISGQGFAVGDLCNVDADGKTYDCGFMQLGDEKLPLKRFVVYLGLADSGAARELVDIRVKQERDRNFAHTVPNGFDAIEHQVVTRTLP